MTTRTDSDQLGQVRMPWKKSWGGEEDPMPTGDPGCQKCFQYRQVGWHHERDKRRQITVELTSQIDA